MLDEMLSVIIHFSGSVTIKYSSLGRTVISKASVLFACKIPDVSVLLLSTPVEDHTLLEAIRSVIPFQDHKTLGSVTPVEDHVTLEGVTPVEDYVTCKTIRNPVHSVRSSPCPESNFETGLPVSVDLGCNVVVKSLFSPHSCASSGIIHGSIEATTTSPVSEIIPTEKVISTTDTYSEGDVVFIMGFGLQNPLTSGSETVVSMVARGHVMKVVVCGGEAVMLVTSAVVEAGMSGGLVVHGTTGRAIAMVVSNTRQDCVVCFMDNFPVF